jgi:pimeloyl-ACP methyl ester carboxylesterase
MSNPFQHVPLRSVQLANGLQFHYVEGGEGLPLVFIHGGAGDYTTWAPQWAAFSSRYRTLSYSRRFSHPNTNPDPQPNHSAHEEAADLAELIDCWQARPAILVGASYGAFTALALAMSRPDQVRALVLIEPPILSLAGESREGAVLRAQFEANVLAPSRDAFMRGDDTAAMSILAGGIAGQQMLDDSAHEARMQTRLRNLRPMKVLSASDRQFPVIEPQALSRIDVPALLVSGECTAPLWREIFVALTRHMPRAESMVVPGAGHAVARDQPDEFNCCTLDFLARHGLS